MGEPGWVNGDDFARGLVEECPECGAIALRDGQCGECGHEVEQGVDPDYYGDIERDEAAFE